MISALVLALLAADEAPRERWEEQALPLRRGVMQFAVGAGPTFTRGNDGTLSFVGVDSYDGTFRFGITDRIELELLSLRIIVIDASEHTPGLILLGGLRGLGGSNVEGVIAAPEIGVRLFSRHARFIGTLEGFTGGRVSALLVQMSSGVRLGGLANVSRVLTLGAELTWRARWLDTRTRTPWSGFELFVRPRWHLTEVWALDTWVSAGDALGVGLSIVWAPSNLWGTPEPRRWY